MNLHTPQPRDCNGKFAVHRVPEIERFMRLVMPEPNSGCWIWLGRIVHGGYGRYARAERAHLASLRLHGIIVPDGLVVDHKCRVRLCVNPDHLEPVTHLENMLRGNTIIRRAIEATHCIRGHPFSGDNLYLHKGVRRCRTCTREAYRRRTEKRRQERAAA